MRYQNEIEEILKISDGFGSKLLNKYYVLKAIYVEGLWKNNDLASLSHKLTNMSTLLKHRNKIVRFVQDFKERENNLTSKFSNFSPPEKTLWVDIQKAILPKLEDSLILLETGYQKLIDLREEVKSILTNSGHCDPTDLLPYLEVGNQDQIAMLQIMFKWVYPNGRSHCSDPKVVETEDTTELPNMSLDSNVIETEGTTELPYMSLDSKVIGTEVPKNDMVTADLNTQDTQLNPKPNPMPKKTITPRHKFKRIKKSGKVQKIQSPGVHKMEFNPPHKLADSQNTPMKSPNISCDSTVPDTGIPKSNSSKMVLEV